MLFVNEVVVLEMDSYLALMLLGSLIYNHSIGVPSTQFTARLIQTFANRSLNIHPVHRPSIELELSSGLDSFAYCVLYLSQCAKFSGQFGLFFIPPGTGFWLSPKNLSIP